AGHHISEGHGNTAAAQCGFGFDECAARQACAIASNHDDIRAIVSELLAQLGLHVGIQIEHGGCDRRSHDHCQQSRGGASTPQHSGAYQHSQKHGGVWLARSARNDLSRFMRKGTQASPRNANTGSNKTAFRIAAALPANVTTTAMTRMIGKRTGWIEMSESKIARPICRANTRPAP